MSIKWNEGSSYPTSFDYSAYNPQYYNGMRAGYYGNALAAGATAAYTGTALSAEASSELSAFTLKCDRKGGKSAKKKKTGSCSPGDAHFARVFVWELDDICTLTTSSLNGLAHKAPQFSRAVALLQNFAARVVALTFPADQLEESELCNVEDAALEESLGDGALVDGRPGRTRCGMSSQKDEINDACRQIEQLFGGRTDAARRWTECRQRTAVSSEKYANVVLCSRSASGSRCPVVAGRPRLPQYPLKTSTVLAKQEGKPFWIGSKIDSAKSAATW
ncbi:hypothetical protein OSTOST_19279 [Ostertagia ostertagi]